LGAVHGCAGPTMHQVWAEATVWSYLDRLFQAPDLVAQVVREASKRTKYAEPKSRTRIDAIGAEIAVLEAKQRKWMERLEESDSVSDVLWKRIKELEARRVSLSEEARALEAQLLVPAKRPLSAEDVSRALAKIPALGDARPEQRRLLIERLVYRHDLRVRVLDRGRLAVSLRLDPADDEAPRGAVGSRLVLAGQGVPGGPRVRACPIAPGSPVPGGPASRTL
jgi:hypothetical protein